jgi:insertion element IS1 protein InsB
LILLGFVAGYIPEPDLSGRALESGSFLSVTSCPDTPGTPSTAALWAQIPAVYPERATFDTGQYEVYWGIISPAQHRTITQLARQTNQVERFNCPLRQRVSRSVRALLSFFKKLSHHIGAIRYFICD